MKLLTKQEYKEWLEEERRFEALQRQAGKSDLEANLREYEQDLKRARERIKAELRFMSEGAFKRAIEVLGVLSPFDAVLILDQRHAELQKRFEEERQRLIDSINIENMVRYGCSCRLWIADEYPPEPCHGEICGCPLNSCECQWATPPPSQEEIEALLEALVEEDDVAAA